MITRQAALGLTSAAVLLAASVTVGALALRPRKATPQTEVKQQTAMPSRGHWNVARDRATAIDPEAVSKLQAIGYLSGYRPDPGRSSVTMRAPQAFDGVNLYTSGHAAEAVLVGMDGEVLHRWRCTYERAFPDQPPLPSTPSGREHWRRVRMLPGGDLLAIYEGQGLVRLSLDSAVRWALPIGAHHDLAVREDGTIVVLTREVVLRKELNATEPILEDFVTEISQDGKVLRTISILDAFLESAYRPLLRRSTLAGDILHTNTLELLDGRHAARVPAFAAGNLLLSSPHLDTIAVLDPRQKKIVWAASGMFHFQHEPLLLPDGDLLLLDNRGARGLSRVLQFDPVTQQVRWLYEGFSTEFNGSVQRLPNGNTLIVESDAGRAFEVTPGKEIVWEFYNPHRAGKTNELIASLFDLVRLPASVVTDIRRAPPSAANTLQTPHSGC